MMITPVLVMFTDVYHPDFYYSSIAMVFLHISMFQSVALLRLHISSSSCAGAAAAAGEQEKDEMW